MKTQIINDKLSINISDSINRYSIKGFVPTGAKYAKLNPSGKFIEMFYRVVNIKFNDGTNKDVLEYKSECGCWTPSDYNSNNKHLTYAYFLEIID
jgi:hypothetical protein